MFPVGAIAGAAAAVAAHARRVQDQKKAVAAACPVWDQVAARLGFRASRTPRHGYPELVGSLDDVACALRLVDAGGGASARVEASARAHVAAPWKVRVRTSSRLTRWMGWTTPGAIGVGDLAFDRTFTTSASPRVAAPRLFAERRARELLVAFAARGAKTFAYERGLLGFSWPGVEAAPSVLEAAIELLVVIGRHDPATVLPYR